MKVKNAFYKAIWTALLFFLTINSQAQTKSIALEGQVTTSKKQPLEYTAVRLLRSDSSVAGNTLSDARGRFRMASLAPGKYSLKVSFVGFKTANRKIELNTEKTTNNIGTIELEEGIDLKEVVLSVAFSTVIVKGDTTEFNSSSYKTTADAMAEGLIKKLPGMQVDKAGNIQADGERVSKITVDGKEFFGSDPRMATHNIPADAIAKVQLIDDKTEQAKNSGIDDGKRQKTINLVLKADKKQGWFGSVSAAKGDKGRYLISLSGNRFTKNMQFSIITGSNNMSQGYSKDEATNFNGGNSSGSMTGSARFIGGIPVGNLAGLNRTNSGGLNYSNSLGKKKQLKYSGSYYLNGVGSLAEQKRNTETLLPTGHFSNNTTSLQNSNNVFHRFNNRLVLTADSLNTVTFIPNIGLSLSNSLASTQSVQLGQDKEKLYDADRQGSLRASNPTFEGSLLYSHKLHNKKGILSLSVTGNYVRNTSNVFYRSANTYYKTASNQLIDRNEDRRGENNAIAVNASLNRALGKNRKISVFINNDFKINQSVAGQKTLEYDPVSGWYTLPVDSLGNTSNNHLYTFATSLGISRTFSKGVYTISNNFQGILMDGAIGNGQHANPVKKEYFTVVPQANLLLRPKAGVTWSLSAGGRFSPPQFQDLVLWQANTDPLNIRQGNPNLMPARSYNAQLTYSQSNRSKNSFLRISALYSRSLNSIARDNTLNLLSGIRHSVPVNVHGGHYLSLSISGRLPLKTKNFSISPLLQFSKSKNIGFLNSMPNVSRGLSGWFLLNTAFDYKEIANLTLSNSLQYTKTRNSATLALKPGFFNMENELELSLEPVKTWVLSSTVSQTLFYRQHVSVLNLGLQKFFMKKRQLAAELKAFDLLNQNSQNSIFASENQVIETYSNGIRKFVALKLTYRVNRLSATR